MRAYDSPLEFQLLFELQTDGHEDKLSLAWLIRFYVVLGFSLLDHTEKHFSHAKKTDAIKISDCNADGNELL